MFRASSIFTFLLWVLFCKLVVSETLQRYISELEDQIEGEQGKSFRSRHLLKELQQEIQTLEREFATSERILFQCDQEKEIWATKYAKLESDYIRLESINLDLADENKLLNKHADDITISYARKLHADDKFQDMNKHYEDMIIDLEDRLQKGIFKSATGTMKEEVHNLEAELRLLRESLQFQREHVIDSLVKILDGTGSSKDVQQLMEDLLAQVAELKASLESEKHAKSGAIKQKNILLSQLEKMNNILTTQEDELSLLRNPQTTPVIPYTPRPSFSSIVTLNEQ